MMNIYCILSSIFFITCISGSNTTTTNIDKVLNNIVTDKGTSSNSIKFPLQSEGALIPPGKSVLSSKDNITVDLLNLEEGFGKTKEKPIQARKGVNLLDELDSKNNAIIDLNTSEKGSITIPEQPETNLKKSANSTAIVSTPLHRNISTITQNLKKHMTTTAIQTEKTEKPKKPLKTVYETLASLAQAPVTAKTSAHTLILNQIPSPKDGIAGKNPGMITPLIITILVVPMFAVLGYMALRRGQEAWKNRHYKRMDFLLDGMYND